MVANSSRAAKRKRPIPFDNPKTKAKAGKQKAKPDPQFKVGDIVCCPEDDHSIGLVEAIHKHDTLVTRDLSMGGKPYSNCQAHPAKDCFVSISIEDIMAVVNPKMMHAGKKMRVTP